MPESPEVTQLRIALTPEKDAESFPIPRRKHMAELAIDRVLDVIARNQWPFGRWEAYCIAVALDDLNRGAYDAARVAAVEVLRPPPLRDVAAGIPEIAPRTVEQLKHDLMVARVRPVTMP